MKKSYISILIAAITASVLVCCSKQSEMDPNIPENGAGQYCSLELSSVSPSDFQSKAAIDGTSFPQDGHIGLFLYADDKASQPYGDGYENVQYSYNDIKSKWTASPSIKVGSTPGHLFGYYPYDSEVANIKAIPVTSSLNGDDVMYASKQEQPITDLTAANTSIKMNHALARVAIKVINNGYTGGANLSSIKFEDATIASSGTLNAIDGSITASKANEVALSVPAAEQPIATGDGTTYECLLVPSEIKDERQDVWLYLTIDEQEKNLKLSGNNGVIFKPGVKSTVTITLNNKGIALKSVSINDWNIVEVGGHKVTVKLSDDEGISDDLIVQVASNGSSVIVKTYSDSGKKLVIRNDDATLVAPVEDGNKSIFTISDITSDITATLAYAKTRTVSVNVAGVDKAPNVSGYVYGKAEPITVIEGRPSILTAIPGGGYAVDYFNVKGTKYGDKAEVVIPNDVETIDAYFRYIDMLGGIFSVSDKTKVRFSRGNLWCDGTDTGYSAATPKIKSWGFESKQYESTPSSSGYRTISHISHFMWCKSAEQSVKEKYSETGTAATDTLFTNASATSPSLDFAVNGQKGFWRALSGGDNGEWKYLIERKDSEGNALYKLGVKVCGSENCLILLPDDWKWGKNGVGTVWQNEYSESTTIKWSTMEAAGAVCLPAAGSRNGSEGVTSVSSVGYDGDYWSSTPSGGADACDLYFDSDDVLPAYSNDRGKAFAVRLVTDVK